MSQPHDSGYKYLFSAPEFVRDLILGFVPDEWLHGLDFTTLEPYPGSYITEDFRSRADDVVWRIRVGEYWAYLYLLIEFQSTVDRYMALRMMVYQGLLYQDLVRKGDISSDGRLPPILPIVLYNGQRKWTAVEDVYDLIVTVPSLVEQFKPRVRYLLVDEQSYPDGELASKRNLVAALFRLEQNPLTMGEVLESLQVWLRDEPELRRMFSVWIRASLGRRIDFGEHLPEVNDLQELKIMMTDRLEEWAKEREAKGLQQGMQQGRQEGRREGRQEGRQEGEALALQRLLARRFGEVSPAVLDRIGAASREQIEAWLDRVLEAPTLEAVFAPLTH